jgi:hypothetical protein
MKWPGYPYSSSALEWGTITKLIARLAAQADRLAERRR